MRKSKREVTYDGSTYKVRSDKIVIPDFAQMQRFEVLKWMCRHTYACGHSRPSPQGFGGAISLISSE